ncbi:hypothetical protein DVH05_010043 [Phytophthora capsici]|nr:hypothetical protein DVH05_010043 [Phytophthora capsici]
MNLRAFLVAVAASFTVVASADVTYANHTAIQPFPQPTPTTTPQKAAVKFKPQLHISYGCHPYPAVQADGVVSAGLKPTGPDDGECQGSSLGSQIYARSDWYKGKYAIMYTWYLPKGSASRHFWESVVVWIDDPAAANSTILGVSLNYGLQLKKETNIDPKYLSGSSLKLDSFPGFAINNPKLRLTELDGEFQDLVTFDQLTDAAGIALSHAEFSKGLIKAKTPMPLIDGVFNERLKDAWPF